jgi:MinD-like ATPase involved in chromosome partitioning or flagellar assembly
MASEPDDDRPLAARRAAQSNAGELARMGIDPRTLGLDPASSSSPPPATPAWVDTTLSRPIGGIPRPPAPEPAGYAAQVQRLVAPPRTGPPGGWRRVARAVTHGLLRPDAAAEVERERELVARARIRRPEPRMIAFLAGKGGVGTTTTAAGVAVTLAILRNDPTALVSARSGTGSLGRRLAGRPAPPVPALAGAGPAAAPLRVHGNLAVVDGSPWHTPTPRGTLLQLLAELRDQHPITVVDVGNDLGEPAQGALGRADQIVLVTSASQDAVAATRTALSRVHQVDPFRLASLVVAVTCLSERQYRRTARRLRAELGVAVPRVVPVGFDPWLATGDRLDPARLRPATREAYLRIAGLIVEPGTADQWFSPSKGVQ